MEKIQKLRVLVADDEAPARNRMVRFLSKFEMVEVINVSSNGEDALENILMLKPNIVFLDIEMPGLTGLEVAAKIPPDQGIHIVFATAYNEHAIQAFELNAVDYLLKPFNEERIRQTIERISKRGPNSNTQNITTLIENVNEMIEGANLNKIPIPAGDRFILVDFKDIICIEVEDRSTNIFTADGRSYPVNQTLESFEKKLPPEMFIRVSRSCIVNLNAIKELALWFSNRYKVILINKKEVISSRERSKALKDLIKF